MHGKYYLSLLENFHKGFLSLISKVCANIKKQNETCIYLSLTKLSKNNFNKSLKEPRAVPLKFFFWALNSPWVIEKEFAIIFDILKSFSFKEYLFLGVLLSFEIRSITWELMIDQTWKFRNSCSFDNLNIYLSSFWSKYIFIKTKLISLSKLLNL